VLTPAQIVMDEQVLGLIRGEVPDGIIEPAPAIDMPTAYIDRAHLVDVCRTLRDHPSLQFSFLVEITAADFHPADPRFEVVYHFACLGEAFAQSGGPAPLRRLRLKVRVSGSDAWVPTLTSLWPAANWLEREVFDLFGVAFTGHPDLRRILTPDDWVGHPLRKDYPVQVRKDAAAWSPMELTVEEFTANVRATRAASASAAADRGPAGTGH
jgi:NADH-quinone oxidoreductase subunit C